MDIKFSSEDIYKDFENELDAYINLINKSFSEETYSIRDALGRIYIDLEVEEKMPEFLQSSLKSRFKEKGFELIETSVKKQIVKKDEIDFFEEAVSSNTEVNEQESEEQEEQYNEEQQEDFLTKEVSRQIFSLLLILPEEEKIKVKKNESNDTTPKDGNKISRKKV